MRTLSILTIAITLGLGQPSTVIILPAPMPFQSALSYCEGLGTRGSYSMYPVPATPTDPVYKVLLETEPGPPAEQRFWIRRRGGMTCTVIKRVPDGGDQLEETICDEMLRGVCKDCRFGGDGCGR